MKRYILSIYIGAISGAALTVVGILCSVFLLDINGLSLQTGVQVIDSMLYSLGGPSAIFVAAFIWAAAGGLVGGVFGLFVAMRNVSTSKHLQTHPRG